MNNVVRTKKDTELPLLNLQGKNYLPVAYRVVWFREERPNWRIETSFVHLGDTSAIAKAVISNENGDIIATSHKAEDKQGFRDFMEKAETGAIGRALALCGYGTQFTDDLEEGNRLADSPTPIPVARTTPSKTPTVLPKPVKAGPIIDSIGAAKISDFKGFVGSLVSGTSPKGDWTQTQESDWGKEL